MKIRRAMHKGFEITESPDPYGYRFSCDRLGVWGKTLNSVKGKINKKLEANDALMKKRDRRHRPVLGSCSTEPLLEKRRKRR